MKVFRNWMIKILSSSTATATSVLGEFSFCWIEISRMPFYFLQVKVKVERNYWQTIISKKSKVWFTFAMASYINLLQLYSSYFMIWDIPGNYSTFLSWCRNSLEMQFTMRLRKFDMHFLVEGKYVECPMKMKKIDFYKKTKNWF